ncbi:MAG: flavin reductase family protein [Chitinophagaceae bacterium]|nr:MAG: flavin reductase family protein [Chitinophagaceae bacterium]
MLIELASLTPAERQYYLQHVVAPRPICFASTINSNGEVNLSPFSFFNLFSANPPILVFSPSRRVRDKTQKHTLENVQQVPEVVINIVTYDIVHQASLASCDYPAGVDEFVKAGFTPQAATVVRPPMVKESKVKMECRVNEIKPLGDEGGAGNLVICEVLRMHIDDTLFDENGKLDQRKIQHVARLGGDWYTRVNEASLFILPKPNVLLGIGFDQLPASIRNSMVLTGNELGQLANVHELPMIDAAYHDDHLKNIIQYYSINPAEMERELHLHAQVLLAQGRVADAWQVLLSGET